MSYISSVHMLNVLKAAELLSKGIDISKLSYEEFKQVLVNKEGKIVKRVTPLVEDFVIHIDDIDVCGYYYKNSNIKRTGRNYAFCTDSDTVNLTLNSDTFKQIVRTLYKLYDITGGLEKIYYDEEYEKEYNNFKKIYEIFKFVYLLLEYFLIIGYDNTVVQVCQEFLINLNKYFCSYK